MTTTEPTPNPAAPRPTRVLLSLRYLNGTPVDAEVSRKAALLLTRQAGVVKAEGGMGGNLELHYNALEITLTDVTRLLARANLRLGII